MDGLPHPQEAVLDGKKVPMDAFDVAKGRADTFEALECRRNLSLEWGGIQGKVAVVSVQTITEIILQGFPKTRPCRFGKMD
jgi:hypothetical protein